MKRKFNVNTHTVGPLCKNNHKYQDKEESVRYKSTRQCVDCMDEWRKATKERYKETHKKTAFKNYHLNREKRISQMAEYRKTENFRTAVKKYYQENKETMNKRVKEWRQTTRGRIIVSKLNRERRLLKLNSVKIPYSTDEIYEHFQIFNHMCAYCLHEANTVDHFVPLSKGGIDGLSNLLPACRTCNLSKGANDAKLWFKRQPFYSRKQWNKIRKALSAHFQQNTTQTEHE